MQKISRDHPFHYANRMHAIFHLRKMDRAASSLEVELQELIATLTQPDREVRSARAPRAAVPTLKAAVQQAMVTLTKNEQDFKKAF
ncbi:hypothetical protein PRK78_005899 [Emydomyces testavorans]|uniref:Uncharacterized protein n=1 Tax=Emydomyces testavorans TaxID=2070801 RepID=A0AAF0DLK5_9EURO|nr:hypothetical protein PRK78_005899 [Emydomyces testavorans]